MVVLNVKRAEQFLFLYETSLNTKVESVRDEICLLINGRLKVLRITDAMVSLARHGIAKAPKMRGLLDEQIAELKLFDEDMERCEPAGGFVQAPDPVGFRVGRAPTSTFQEILIKPVKDAEDVMKNVRLHLTPNNIKKAIQDLKEAVKIVYPMGLPEYDPVRMELENREILVEYHNKELTHVADPQDTKLWFASKELLAGNILGDHLGNNEKTKVILKVASKTSGQPCREPLLSEQEEKLLLMHSAKRREELQNLDRNSDDSYHATPWADQQSLKKKVLGLDNISWRQF